MNTIRLFLVDDEPHVRRGLRMRLEMEPDFSVVGEAGEPRAAIEAIVASGPDVVLMDIQMPGADGIAVASELHAVAPDCAVVIVSMQDDAGTRRRAASAGAVGFVGKHEIDTTLTAAVRDAAASLPTRRCLRGWIGDPPHTAGQDETASDQGDLHDTT